MATSTSPTPRADGPSRPSAKAARAAAAAEAARLREEAARRARRGRVLGIGLLALAVLALVVAVVVVLGSEEKPIGYQGEPGSISLSEVKAPDSANEDGGIPVGQGLVAGTSNEGAVVVEAIFDYRCPWCAVFDEANAADLEALAQEGRITLVYRPVSFLDKAEGSRQYSTRSATAAAIVADRAPEHFLAFSTALMQNQPEKGQGPSDEDIAAVARSAGVPEDVVAQLTETAEGSERTFARWVFAATERADEMLGGLTTPSVFIDGERFPGEGDDPEALYKTGPLREAIEARLGS